MTTRNEIAAWFNYGALNGYTHMIVVCDTFDYEDYPVYVEPGEDVHKRVAACRAAAMQRVMEVYNLSKNCNEQLAEYRAFNY